MHKLLEYVCDELEELERKADKDGKLSMAEIQYGDVLAHMKKNLLTADAMTGEGEYSSEDGSMSYRGSYEGGRGGRSYARGRGRNARRDSMGRYSSRENDGYSRAEDDMDDMISELRGMMGELPPEKQKEVQRFIQKIEQM